MPELPEVQRVVETLRPVAEGRVLREIRPLREDFVTPARTDWSIAAGRTIRTVRRRAKRIIFELDGPVRCFAHLGMTGRFAIEPPQASLAPHTHVIFDLGEVQLRQIDPRRFGGLHWLGTDDAEVGLGPEPLELQPAMLAKQLARTRRAVKTALLDQRVVAGLGNIYVDEALYAAGIHPMTPSCEVDEAAVRRLNRATKRILKTAIAAGGSSIRDYVDAEGRRGGFQNAHKVYGREGEPCRRCRTTIERIVLGQRSTHFCPKCQTPAA